MKKIILILLLITLLCTGCNNVYNSEYYSSETTSEIKSETTSETTSEIVEDIIDVNDGCKYTAAGYWISDMNGNLICEEAEIYSREFNVLCKNVCESSIEFSLLIIVDGIVQKATYTYGGILYDNQYYVSGSLNKGEMQNIIVNMKNIIAKRTDKHTVSICMCYCSLSDEFIPTKTTELINPGNTITTYTLGIQPDIIQEDNITLSDTEGEEFEYKLAFVNEADSEIFNCILDKEKQVFLKYKLPKGKYTFILFQNAIPVNIDNNEQVYKDIYVDGVTEKYIDMSSCIDVNQSVLWVIALKQNDMREYASSVEYFYILRAE